MVVVCYVGVGQYLVVVVNCGDVVVVCGVVVDGDEFVDDVVIVDYQFGVFVCVFFVLWFVVDCGVVDEMVVVVDLGWIVDGVVWIDFGVGVDFDIGIDQVECVDVDIGCQLG